MKLLLYSFIILNLLINSSLSHSHYPITKDSALQVAKGKILYDQNCASCHMSNLSGAKNWKGYDEDGHRLAPPLNGTGHTWHHSDSDLHKIIKLGFAKLIKNYEGKMIGFGDILNDSEIDSVLAYIKSYWSEEKYNIQLNISVVNN